jgi:TonB family protein
MDRWNFLDENLNQNADHMDSARIKQQRNEIILTCEEGFSTYEKTPPLQERITFSLPSIYGKREVTKSIFPDAPSFMNAQGSNTNVFLEFFVLPNGNVRGESIKVLGSSGFPKFDSAVVSALEQWTFSPVQNTSTPQKQTIYFYFHGWRGH